MTTVNSSTQVNVFNSIVAAIRNNSTLGARFNNSSFYEFMPHVKSNSFRGYPFMVVEIPEVSDQEAYIGPTTNKEKEFRVPISMYVEYDARSNVSNYCSEMLSTFDKLAAISSGHNVKRIDMISSPEVGTIQQKDVIITDFELVLFDEVV